ncbi:hypothetical protein GOEFS_054_00660 [Gordonia effusa NBRC 100432]|uniref:Uncharacterized protein n=1 Tax=Gordonia effusa NBRC 100432 TaxID=1077974 RepID=H0R051_9ACTN|nr:hypothetical protein [Gordonia effusa]GAB18452.1 hypothetical protein GOEFS_054_00660 [Gordonia effusa NBRC 100432]
MDATGAVRRVKLSSGYRILTERRAGPLPARRASARLSAYVYGNILALAAVVIATPAAIVDGHAAAVVIATGMTTYVAHVFSEFVAQGSIPSDDTRELPPARRREHALQELSDATPIATSASLPAIALALGWLDILPASWAFLAAGAIVIFRIATVQVVTERIRGNPLTPQVFVAGLVTAAVAALIVVLKVLLTH